MKRLIKGFLMSVSMFSSIPLPVFVWEEGCESLVILFFPFVGAVIGLAWYFLAYLILPTALGVGLKAAVLLLVPLFLSGFLHIDGYMDTADAVFSRRPLEDKKRILKDSNIGAFASVALCVFFLLAYSGMTDIVSRNKSIFPFLTIPVFSRCLTGIALLNLKPLSQTGFGASFRRGTKKSYTFILAGVAILSVLAGFALGELQGVKALIAVLLFSGGATWFLYSQFKGISGDLCGAILTVSELSGVLALAIF